MNDHEFLDDLLAIDVDDVGPQGLDLDLALPAAAVAAHFGADGEFRPGPSDAHLTARVVRVEDVLSVRGRCRLDFVATCSRCLGPVRLPVSAPLALTVVPRQREPAAGPDGELHEDDLGITTYDGTRFDLAGALRDEVLLGLPMRALCRGDCAGLCPGCGIDRNVESCRCAAPVSVRWQALRHIKLG